MLARLTKVLITTLTAIYIASMIVFLTQPLFILEGGARGYIGIMGYRIEVGGREVRSPTLDSISPLASPIVVSLPAAALAAASNRIKRLGGWIALGGAGVAAIASGISVNTLNMISYTASQIALSVGQAALVGTAAPLALYTAYFSSIALLITTAAHIATQTRGLKAQERP